LKEKKIWIHPKKFLAWSKKQKDSDVGKYMHWVLECAEKGEFDKIKDIEWVMLMDPYDDEEGGVH
jgi:hypothetical protein